MFSRVSVNLFTGVSLVPFLSGGTRSLLGVGTHLPRHGSMSGGGYLSRHGVQWDTVSKRAVRILLECFLVNECSFYTTLLIKFPLK